MPSQKDSLFPSTDPPWEPAWTLDEQANTALHSSRGLRVRYSSASSTSLEKPGKTLVSIRRREVLELELVVIQRGKYKLDLELGGHSAWFPSCGIIAKITLCPMDGGGAEKECSPTDFTFHDVHEHSESSSGVFVAAEIPLTETSKCGSFEFALLSSLRAFRLRVTMTPESVWAIGRPKVHVGLRRIPKWKEMNEAEKEDGSVRSLEEFQGPSGVNMYAKVRRERSAKSLMGAATAEEEEFATHPFYQQFGSQARNSLKSFVAFFALGGEHSSKFSHAGSRTFHELGLVPPTLMALSDEPEKSLNGEESPRNELASKALPATTHHAKQMIPLRTVGASFVEDLTSEPLEHPNPAECNSETEFKQFVLGRDVLLRGVNLSGNTKLPMGTATHLPQDFAKMKDSEYCKNGITFVGRPFPLEEADEHLARLARWGFNALRFIITWEAVEHAGPGEHDEAYLAYVEAVIEKCGPHGLYVFIDPHQDVWSRFTGGSGAPAWTLELCGLDIANLEPSMAAFTHYNSSPKDPRAFKKMTWPQNYQRFATMHMFTLFFGGKRYAPKFFVDKDWHPRNNTSPERKCNDSDAIHVQDFLQNHYMAAIKALAVRLAKFSHVIGFDTLNEPSAGFIGKSLDKLPATIIPPGRVFRPFDGMVCAAGYSRRVGVANAIGLISGAEIANQNNVPAWLPGRTDVWRDHGVWISKEEDRPMTPVMNSMRRLATTPRRAKANKPEDGSTVPLTTPQQDEDSAVKCELLEPDYFTRGDVNFFRDFLMPFAMTYRKELVGIRSNWIIFIEGDAFGHDDFYWPQSMTQAGGIVNATHWYDGATLFTRQFHPSFTIDVKSKWPVFGKNNIKSMHTNALMHIINLPRDPITLEKCVMPTLIGEFGVPYDLNDFVGFKTGDFSAHEAALSVYYKIFDELKLSSTQWNYSIENDNVYGDKWNLEDLSIFSPAQRKKIDHPDSGSRAQVGFSRPWAPIVAGKRLNCRFYHSDKIFMFKYFPTPANFAVGDPLACTVVYLPDCQFLDPTSEEDDKDDNSVKLQISIRSGTYIMQKLPGRHMLYIWAVETRHGIVEPVEITVTKEGHRGVELFKAGGVFTSCCKCFF